MFRNSHLIIVRTLARGHSFHNKFKTNNYLDAVCTPRLPQVVCICNLLISPLLLGVSRQLYLPHLSEPANKEMRNNHSSFCVPRYYDERFFSATVYCLIRPEKQADIRDTAKKSTPKECTNFISPHLHSIMRLLSARLVLPSPGSERFILIEARNDSCHMSL